VTARSLPAEVNPVFADEAGRPTLTLRHAVTGEEKSLPVLHAEPRQRLLVRWGLAGLYVYDVQGECLWAGRRMLPWREAGDPKRAFRIWHEMTYPHLHEKIKKGDQGP
jgi:hypothetical protein